MGITKCVQEYHCDSGCEIDGCPGHTATLEFNSTANVYHLDMGDGKDLWLDNSSAQAIIDLFTFFSDTRADTARVRNTQSQKLKEFANWLQGVMWDEPDKDFEELADDFLKLP